MDASPPPSGRHELIADPAGDTVDDGCGAAATLSVDLDAVVANWRLLAGRASPAACAAVVKADGYGLGVARVAPALVVAGCRTLFTATVDEAVALRRVLGRADIAILALNGAVPGDEGRCAASDVVPVINGLGQLARWRAVARARGEALPLALQLDTGMSRFGLSPAEAHAVACGDAPLDGLRPTLLMSHLACADTPADGANASQRARFEAARALLGSRLGVGVRLSLAASSGIFLGRAFHYDLVRPGAALFGVAPNGDGPNPMRGVATLLARVMQVRTVPAGTAVGYGAGWIATRPTRLATVAAGYADGFLRANGNRSSVALPSGALLPVRGRVSMDSIVIDATAREADGLGEGDLVELIGPHRSIDDVARDAGTIGYEILTALGARYRRRYRGADGSAGERA